MLCNRLKALNLALTAAILLAVSATTHAQQRVPWTHGGPLLPDSSNFVTANELGAIAKK